MFGFQGLPEQDLVLKPTLREKLNYNGLVRSYYCPSNILESTFEITNMIDHTASHHQAAPLKL